MKINYIKVNNSEHISDYKRRIKDKYFEEDPKFERKYLIDDSLKSYTLDDCMLVRTTDSFPFNHEIHTPLYDGAYDFGGSIYFHYIIVDKLREIYGDKWEKEYEKYKIFSENPRDTLHFTINGLVQSHMQGDFEERRFIILEPLKYHIDDSIRSLRPEDTYYKGNMSLSSEATLIINEDVFNEIKDNPNYTEELESYNIFVYQGNNQAMAVREVLNMIGYDSFLISNSYYTYAGEDYPASDMTDFINEFAKNNNILQIRHSLSDDYNDEMEKRRNSAEEIDTRHLKFLLDNSDLQIEFKNRVLDLCKYYYTDEFKTIILELLDKIGLEKFSILTKKFNDMIILEFNERIKKQNTKC